MYITFKLNGKRYNFEETIDHQYISSTSNHDYKQKMIYIIFEKMSQLIAEGLIRDNIKMFENVVFYKNRFPNKFA